MWEGLEPDGIAWISETFAPCASDVLDAQEAPRRKIV